MNERTNPKLAKIKNKNMSKSTGNFLKRRSNTTNLDDDGESKNDDSMSLGSGS